MSSPDAPAITSPSTESLDRNSVHFGFENTYARLPEHFYARLNPTPVAAPRLIKVNVELARNLGLDPDARASEVLRFSLATAWPRGLSLWQLPMPGTSSDISFRNSAMAAPICLGRYW